MVKKTKAKKARLVDVSGLSISELLKNYGAIFDELRRRDVIRSANNPLSDYAEFLFCRMFGWRQMRNSTAGFDAVDDEKGSTYQIKARRLSAFNASRQLSPMRKLNFDFLAGLLVDKDFEVYRAAIIPVAIVRERSVHVPYTNSWKFLLRDEIWRLPGVRDVTTELRITRRALDRLVRRG